MSTQVSTPLHPREGWEQAQRQLRTEPSAVAMLPETAARAAWRYRWQLAPIAGTAGVLTCGLTVPGGLAVPLLAGAGGVELWRRKGWKPKGRMWLSARERLMAAVWLGAAGGWTVAAPWLPEPAGAGLLFAGVAYPSVRWAQSRIPKRVKLSGQALAWINTWDSQESVWGPDQVRGSKADRSTASEPSPGAVAFEVQLRAGVHGKAASADSVRQQVETDFRLPVDTMRITTVRKDSTRIQVVIAASRHLETEKVPWPGALWNDGATTLARALDGQMADVQIVDADGVRHKLLSGTTGSGKSRGLRAILLPALVHGYGVLILLDGGGGTSCPELAPAAKVYAIERDEWKRAIRAVHAVFELRKLRRGRAGLTRFTAGTDDQIITLAIDEAGFVNKRLTVTEQEMVLELLQQGRKLGIQVIQAVQDPMADEIIGGRKARDLLGGGGTVIALRAGGSMASRLTLDSQGKVDLDLTTLPDAPGSAFLIERGQMVSGHPVRLVDAHEEAAGRAAKQVVIRELCVEEEAALEEALAVPPGPDPEETAEQVEESDAALLAILAEGAKRLGDIYPSEDGEPHPSWKWSRKTASNGLMRLATAGKVTKNKDVWSLREGN